VQTNPHPFKMKRIMCFTAMSIMPFMLSSTPSIEPAGVFINQAGYRPGDAKVFMTDRAAQAFEVLRMPGGEVVRQGVTLGGSRVDPATGIVVGRGDFSTLTDPGRYLIRLEDGSISFEFPIGQDVHDDVARKSLRSFTLQRCGMDLSETWAGIFARPACHLDDATLHSATGRVGHHPTTGGWHDAGDYGKYVHAAAVSIGTMLLMYEQFPGRFAYDDLDIPESGNGIPDFLDEMKWELDWMLKMQITDTEDAQTGGVYYMVNTKDYEWVVPHEDPATRYLHDVASVSTGQFAAVMAQAARCFRSVPALAEDAERYLAAAFRAWEFLEKHPQLVPDGGFIRPEDTKTGGYAEQADRNDWDDRLWAAVELAITTGDARFVEFLANAQNPYIEQVLWQPSEFHGELDWQDVAAFGLIQVVLHETPGISADLRATLQRLFLERCERIARHASEDGFGVALTRYYWGSNGGALALAQYLILGHLLDAGRAHYLEIARDQLHYVMGRNALNHSYVSGVGSRYPRHIHHATFDTDGLDEIYPGLIAGGPNPHLSGDQTLPKYFDASTPPALCYIDHMDSWASNENCILYNAPLVAVAHVLR
jgi:endoglucanase